MICGFGRTGNWWGFETMGFEPDIVPMAKGLSSGYLPIGAVAFSDDLIADFFDNGRRVLPRHDLFRPSGRRAVALKNIEIIEREKLVERTRELGPYFAEAARALPIIRWSARCAPSASSARSSSPATRRRASGSRSPGRVGTICRDHCFNNGLIMRACWDTMVLAPPLVITKKEIDEMVRLARWPSTRPMPRQDEMA